MTKSRSKKTASLTSWIESLDADEIAEALEEATVDAMDDDEQHGGLATMVQEAVVFPFPAKVIGQQVQVVAAEWSDMDSRGVDLIVELDGKRYAIAAQSVELIQPLPEGAVFLAAFLDWKRRF